MIRDTSGNLVTDPSKVVGIWADYFEQLLYGTNESGNQGTAAAEGVDGIHVPVAMLSLDKGKGA